MITSFADRTSEDIYHGAETKAARRIPKDLWSIARRKLDMLNRATLPADLKSPPGNRLKHIGKLYAIRINDQFRITFKFEAGNTSDVLITDYH
jgi:proteic killer suppression protein